MALKQVGENPQLSTPTNVGTEAAILGGFSGLVQSLHRILKDLIYRANRVLPKDGTEAMTGALPLLVSPGVPPTPTLTAEGQLGYRADTNKVQFWDGATWADISSGGGISDGDKGDITVSGGGATWTIDPDVVTYAKIQNVVNNNRFLGRISGAGGDIEELTGTQATTLLDVFTSALKGLAPASGGGTTNFLRADGTWASPPGGGGAPTTVEYIVGALDAGLSAERLASNSTSITVNLGTSGAASWERAALTGDVTAGANSNATTIANDAVSNAKLANMAANSFKGNNTGAPADPIDLTVAQAKTMLDLTGTNSGDQTITLTSDVTGSGTGSFATTIANNVVTYAKMQDVTAASRLLGRGSAAGAGDPEEITLGTNLSMSGTTLNASGGSASLGPLVWLDKKTATGSNVNFVLSSYIAAGYKHFIFWFDHVLPTAAANLEMLFSTDGGASYDNAAGNYRWATHAFTTSAGNAAQGSASATSMILVDSGNAVDSGANDGFTGRVFLTRPETTGSETRAEWEGMYRRLTGDLLFGIKGIGHRNANQDTDAVRFQYAGTTFASGSITLYALDETSAPGSAPGTLAKGTATLDFGSTFTDIATVAVTGQTNLQATANIKAFFMAETTSDNGIDQHREANAICPLVIESVVAGTGFTIRAQALDFGAKGTFKVRWEWSN